MPLTKTRTPIQYTLWPSLYATHDPRPITETWPEVVARFTTHTRVARKNQAPGFGPYVLKSPDAPCIAHGLTTPHRCDACVDRITMLVFDADQGTRDDIRRCEETLRDAGISFVLYSSFSFSPSKAATRLVIPVTRPILPSEFKGLRMAVRDRYQIPCDESACSGVSHFYYRPSAPAGAEVYSTFDDLDPLDPADFPVLPARPAAPLTFAGTVPTDPTIGANAVRAALERRLASLKRNLDPRAVFVENALAGRPVAPDGQRNDAMCKVAGMAAFCAPGAAMEAYREVLEPAVRALQAEGSTITWPEVERMLVAASRKRAALDAQQRDVMAEYEAQRQAARGQ